MVAHLCTSTRVDPCKVTGCPQALGPARAPGGAWRWGLRAHVVGHTAYRLFAPGDFDAPLARARAGYANALCLPLDGLAPAAGADAAGPLYDRAAARVDVEFSAP